MRRHWQKKPLLVRQAWPGVQPPLRAARCSRWRASEDVESRLVQRRPMDAGRCATGRSARAAAAEAAAMDPAGAGLDLHLPAARALLDAFRFLPEARLDDLMVSWASRRRRRRPAPRRLRRLPAAGGTGGGAGASARCADRPGRRPAAEDPAPLSSRARLGAGAGRHALPAAALGTPRRRGRYTGAWPSATPAALHDLLEALQGACSSARTTSSMCSSTASPSAPRGVTPA
jgi:hypothetical protein